MTDRSERTDSERKPRFPRIAFLKRRRRVEEAWYSVANEDFMLELRPRTR